MWKKECGQFCREIHYKRKEEGIEITGCFGEDGQIVLPDEIEGLPVISWKDDDKQYALRGASKRRVSGCLQSHGL